MTGSAFKVFFISGFLFSFFFFGKDTEVKAVRKNSTKLHDNKKTGLLLNILSFLETSDHNVMHIFNQSHFFFLVCDLCNRTTTLF